MSQRVSYGMNEAAETAGIGLTKLREEIAAKRLRARKLGSRTIITREDLVEWAARLPDSTTLRRTRWRTVSRVLK